MTVLGGKRTEPRKPLRRTKTINKVSAKQAKKQRELAQIEPPVDGRCESCHNPPDWRGLAKHHSRFRSHGGSDDRSNIEWLCGRCHSLRHGIKET